MNAKAGPSHESREELRGLMPVHVTVRMMPHVWNLRSRRSFGVIGNAFAIAANRLGARLCEFSVQRNHLHLVVEAGTKGALAAAMTGLGVRIARGLNGMMRRTGRVVAERYHAHVLRTPSQVRRAVHYVRNNHRHHFPEVGARFVDVYSSASREMRRLVAPAASWPLSTLSAGSVNGPTPAEPASPGGRVRR